MFQNLTMLFRNLRVSYSKYVMKLLSVAHDFLIPCYRKACLAGSDEADYRFLKKICQALVNLGINQLALLWVCIFQ